MKNIQIKIIYVLILLCGTPLFAKTDHPVLNWLGDNKPETKTSVTWGVPWARGEHAGDTAFKVVDNNGAVLDSSNWALGYWPDGTVKFSGLTIAADSSLAMPLKIVPGDQAPTSPLKVFEDYDNWIIDTGKAVFDVNVKGDRLIESVDVGGNIVAEHLRVIASLSNKQDPLAEGRVIQQYTAQFAKVTLKQYSTRAVVKGEGHFRCKETGRTLLPFTLRLYFVAGVETVKTQFSFVYNGDQDRDFIAGLQVVMDVPMREDVNNRHVMFAGENDGVWHEASRIMSVRIKKNIGYDHEIYRDQNASKRIAGESGYDGHDLARMRALPIWSDYKLSQVSADSFHVHKRTSPESSWLKASWGRRARGLGFVGDVSGGMAMGLKAFWESFPSAIEINNAHAHKAQIKIWLWSPDAPVMDLRHYDTERHTLGAIYEDAEVGFSTPMGVAHTSDLVLKFYGAAPTAKAFSAFATDVADAPLLVCSPEYYHDTDALGKWSLINKSTPMRKKVEDKLEERFEHLKNEIEQRHWYGFWDYGDIMHAYDLVRHEWRYDIGGFAWANTELAPNMWLWHSFLRSGRSDIFRIAAAMTRHTSDVDVHHLGRFKGLGSRHNVSHWGCSAKQVRVSHAGFHRIYYFLTADDRIGDVMNEVIDADKTTATVSPLRKVVEEWADRAGINLADHPSASYITYGPDWISFVSNWMVAWERTGDTKYRDWIKTGMKCFVDMPHFFFTSSFYIYDPETKKMLDTGVPKMLRADKLSLMMGGFEAMTQVVELVDYPEFDKLWVEYCLRYGWSTKDWKDKTGLTARGAGAIVEHSKLAAYAAWRNKDDDVAKRAWKEFLLKEKHRGGINGLSPQPITHYGDSSVLNPIDEVPWMTSNYYSQWGLAAIALLEFVGDYSENVKDE